MAFADRSVRQRRDLYGEPLAGRRDVWTGTGIAGSELESGRLEWPGRLRTWQPGRIDLAEPDPEADARRRTERAGRGAHRGLQGGSARNRGVAHPRPGERVELIPPVLAPLLHGIRHS